MVDLSKVEDSNVEGETALKNQNQKQIYDDEGLEAFGDFWENADEDMKENIENHKHEGNPFESAIPGNKKRDGYESQVDRDLGDTLEMLPNESMGNILRGDISNTVEAKAQGNLRPEVAENEDELEMGPVDTKAENYLRMNPDEAYSPIQIAEDITPRDSVVTKVAAKEALITNRIQNYEDFEGVRVGELTDLANNGDIVDYHSERESINEMVRENPVENTELRDLVDARVRMKGTNPKVEQRFNGDWLEELDKQQEERKSSVGVDEAMEYLEEENPEAMNEIAIQYVAGQIEEELETKDEHSNKDYNSGGWVESYDRETLEEQGVIGDEDYEVRGETFYTMSDEKMDRVLSSQESGSKKKAA